MPENQENAQLVQAILEKTWDELETLEHAGYLLFPDTLRRRKRDGTWEEIPVTLRVPREPETRRARVQARQWAKEEGLDPQLDPDVFDNMDTMCILAMAIRNATPPHEPWEPDPKVLESKYDRPCLDAMWAKLEALRTVIDPRPNQLSEEDIAAVIASIASTRTTVPLAVFAGAAQNSCVVSMAEQLMSLLGSKSSSV